MLLLAPATLLAQKRTSYVYPAAALQADLRILHSVLESNHPSLYWYTTKARLDSAFEAALISIPDSMQEVQYKNLVSKIVAEIRCGHTSVRFSKRYLKEDDADSIPFFPFDVRVWKDTMVVSGNIKWNNAAIQKGTRITAINGRTVPELLKNMYQYMSCDGYSIGVNEIRLSNSLPAFYRNIFGDTNAFRINYINNQEVEAEEWVPAFVKVNPKDSAVISKTNIKQQKEKVTKQSKEKRMLAKRALTIDTATNTAILRVESFSKGLGLKKFYRDAFRSIQKNGNEQLIVDIRNNGGGLITNYIKLAEYLTKKPFRIADSITAVSRKLPRGKYLEASFLNQIALSVLSSKKKDGLYHFRWYEREVYKPNKKMHFKGNIYILTSGYTFSAATLLTSTLKGQENCTIVGEETGGGAYGNNGMLIPTLTLPNTKLRISLPLCKMVINKNAPVMGRGILPDLEVLPTISSVKNSIDLKLERTLELIKNHRALNSAAQN